MNYKKFLTAAIISISALSLSAQVSTRGGLNNLFAKIERGDSITVGYFGGSITAQAGWRVQSLNYLKDRYKGVNFREINATIGGTGSDLGSLRIDYDLLREKPDLLFVEFAVNDTKTDSLMIVSSMESIVRKTWRSYPDCDICFVYTMHTPHMEDLLAGHFNASVRAMESVAERYQIPTVHLGEEAIKLIKSGDVLLKTPTGVQVKVSGNDLDTSFTPKVEDDGKIYFSPDGVHPFLNTGHVLYTKSLIKALELLESKQAKASKHKLKKALSNDGREFSTPIYIEPSMQSGEWSVVKDSHFESKYKTIWSAKVGSKIELNFKGSTLIAYDLIGPGSVKLKVTVDGKESEAIRFDGYCTYWRIASFTVADGLDPKSEHHAVIEVMELEGKRDILFERNREKHDSDTAPYTESQWQVGNFFAF